jgi:hypothetical protein
MKVIKALLLFIIPAVAAAHPGGGLIALDANTVIFGDSMYNSVWRLEKGKKPQALIKNFHAHWTTLGLDGQTYSEAFQEMGGALFRIDLGGAKHVKIAESSHVNQPVFVVGKNGEIIFQKDAQIIERSSAGAVTAFRGNGRVAKGDSPLQRVIAFAWAADGTLYLSDSYMLGVGELTAPAAKGAVAARLRRVGKDGVVRLVARVGGKLLRPQIWNSVGAPRIWSIAVDDRKRIYVALPDIGQVVRIDADASQHVIDRSFGGWRVTAVATFGNSVFLLDSSDKTNAGQRVRAMRSADVVELLGQVEL